MGVTHGDSEMAFTERKMNENLAAGITVGETCECEEIGDGDNGRVEC